MSDDADDYSTDWKRKANVKVEGSFSKSRKTPRTPIKITKADDKLDQILKLIIGMKEEQKEIKADVQQIRIEQEKFNEEIKRIKMENELLKKENEEIKSENKEIREELREIKNNMEIIEKERRKNNVVISGLNMDSNDPADLKRTVNIFIKEHLKVNVEVTAVTKMGVKTALVELENENYKMDVMRNKAKLRDLRDQRIFINDDLTRKEREKQKQIKLTALEDKQKGKM